MTSHRDPSMNVQAAPDSFTAIGGTARQASNSTHSGVSRAPPSRSTRKWRGKLSKLLELPLDLIFMVMESLEARDLLSLARTSKTFRDILMDRRKGPPLWRSAIANTVGLPQCPPYMPEPAYVNLVYCNHCHECLRNNVTVVYFQWGVRYCKRCMPKKIIDLQDVIGFLDEVRKTTGVDRPLYVWRGELHAVEFETYLRSWQMLAGDDEGRKRLAKSSAEHVALRQQHAWAYMQWKDDVAKLRKAERESLKATRLTAIKERLKEAGYTDELEAITDVEFADQPFANKPALLTDRAWGNIRVDACRFVEERWKLHLRRERHKVIKPRIHMFDKVFECWLRDWDPNKYDPEDPKAIQRMKPGDFLMMKEAQLVLEAPPQSIIVPGSFDSPHASLREIVGRWYDACKASLNALLRTALPNLPEHVDPVSLAICSFDCVEPHCSQKFMNYPDVLEHRCRGIRVKNKELSYSSIVQELLSDEHRPLAWDVSHVRVNSRVLAHHAGAIVRACGSDPFAASPRDLDERSMRMICAACVERDGDTTMRSEVFDWRRAMHHQATLRHRDAPCRWIVLPNGTTAKVRAVERLLRDDPKGRRSVRVVFLCKLGCHSLAFWDFDDLISHSLKRHGMQGNLIIDEHFVEAPVEVDDGLLQGMFIRVTRSGDVQVLPRSTR
ncbi:hypothetical protein BD414DRAFT_130450 [Trametes punicea]|nr:hypothetical protein BD414DRAFT_130450 [Trametes punicea]